MKKLLNICLIAVIVIGLCSCKDDDEDPSKGANQNTGVWTAKLGSTAWVAGKIQLKIPTSGGELFSAYRDNDQSVILFGFEGTKKKGTYTLPFDGSDFFVSVSYYADYTKSSTLEDANEGEVIVTKYDADSLVATFHFKTPTKDFTEGKIKIKLK